MNTNKCFNCNRICRYGNSNNESCCLECLKFHERNEIKPKRMEHLITNEIIKNLQLENETKNDNNFSEEQITDKNPLIIDRYDPYIKVNHRPDLLIKKNGQAILVEIDEDQHSDQYHKLNDYHRTKLFKDAYTDRNLNFSVVRIVPNEKNIKSSIISKNRTDSGTIRRSTIFDNFISDISESIEKTLETGKSINKTFNSSNNKYLRLQDKITGMKYSNIHLNKSNIPLIVKQEKQMIEDKFNKSNNKYKALETIKEYINLLPYELRIELFKFLKYLEKRIQFDLISDNTNGNIIIDKKLMNELMTTLTPKSKDTKMIKELRNQL